MRDLGIHAVPQNLADEEVDFRLLKLKIANDVKKNIGEKNHYRHALVVNVNASKNQQLGTFPGDD